MSIVTKPFERFQTSELVRNKVNPYCADIQILTRKLKEGKAIFYVRFTYSGREKIRLLTVDQIVDCYCWNNGVISNNYNELKGWWQIE